MTTNKRRPKKAAKKDDDTVFITTGREGIGKSAMSLRFAAELGRPIPPEAMTFDIESYLEQGRRQAAVAMAMTPTPGLYETYAAVKAIHLEPRPWWAKGPLRALWGASKKRRLARIYARNNLAVANCCDGNGKGGHHPDCVERQPGGKPVWTQEAADR